MFNVNHTILGEFEHESYTGDFTADGEYVYDRWGVEVGEYNGSFYLGFYEELEGEMLELRGYPTRANWQQLRDLCDTVLARMNADGEMEE